MPAPPFSLTLLLIPHLPTSSPPPDFANKRLYHTKQKGGWDPTTGEIPPSLADEIDQAFANVDLALRTAGGKGWSQVYRVRLYALNEAMGPEGLGRMVENIDKWYSAPYSSSAGAGKGGQEDGTGKKEEGDESRTRPILTGVGVSKLGLPGMRIEIEVAAYAPEE